MASASDGKTMMAIRINRESLAVFDALAEGRGGRSALLRSLLDQAMRQTSIAPRVAPVVNRRATAHDQPIRR